jgi:hypothetical protein
MLDIVRKECLRGIPEKNPHDQEYGGSTDHQYQSDHSRSARYGKFSIFLVQWGRGKIGQNFYFLKLFEFSIKFTK